MTDSSEIKSKLIKLSKYYWALVIIGLVMPLAFGFTLGSFRAGENFGYSFFAWVLMMLLAALLTVKRSEIIKGYGRIAVGSGLVIFSLSSGISDWLDARDEKNAKEAMLESFIQYGPLAPQPNQSKNISKVEPQAEAVAPQTRPKNQAQQNVVMIDAVRKLSEEWLKYGIELDKKFSAVDLTNRLSGENLVSPAERAETRKRIQQLIALINERDKALAAYTTKTGQVVNSLQVDETNKNEFQRGMAEGSAKTKKMYSELSAAQLASMQSIIALLDFADKRQGSLQVNRDTQQILFQNQADLDEFNRLIGNLQKIAANEEVVIKRAAILQQETRRSIVEFAK